MRQLCSSVTPIGRSGPANLRSLSAHCLTEEGYTEYEKGCNPSGTSVVAADLSNMSLASMIQKVFSVLRTEKEMTTSWLRSLFDIHDLLKMQIGERIKDTTRLVLHNWMSEIPAVKVFSLSIVTWSTLR